MKASKRGSKCQLHLDRNGYSYAFRFDAFGIFADLTPASCDFCRKEYETMGVQVSFRCGFEICPACLLAGPQAVAAKARKSRSKERQESAEVLGILDTFTQLPGGVLAVKIAEAAQEAGKEA